MGPEIWGIAVWGIDAAGEKERCSVSQHGDLSLFLNTVFLARIMLLARIRFRNRRAPGRAHPVCDRIRFRCHRRSPTSHRAEGGRRSGGGERRRRERDVDGDNAVVGLGAGVRSGAGR
eukprot:3918109-Rhodomonas_salina.1